MVQPRKKPLKSPGQAQGDLTPVSSTDASAGLLYDAVNDRWARSRQAGLADGQGAQLVGNIPSTPRRHAPAANTAAVITVAAVASQRNVVTYSGANTAGTLTVEDGAGTTVYSEPVAASATAAVRIPFPPGGAKGSANTALIITLPAGGAGISGVLHAGTYTT